MLQQLSHIYIIIFIVSFLCSLISFRLHYPYHLKLFTVFLGITTLTELIANFFLSPLHLSSNYPVYNVFMLVQYPILAFYFKQVLTSAFLKKVATVFLVLYPVFWISIFLFVYNLNQWNTYGTIAGDFFIIVFSVRYLFELFTSERLISFRKHTEFWISVALVFYSCTEFPITGILNFLVQDWQRNQQTILELISILQILNIIMYSIFIYAFLCRINLTEKKL